MRGEEELTCAVCRAELPLAPPGDELVCEGCGAALVIAPMTVWLRSSRKGGVAPEQRRAA
jgi:predicted amidophosphoribosyltransferase